MEWAIELEGQAAAAAGETDDEALPLAFLTTLGVQRVGMSVGLAVVGVLYAAVFTGLYHLMRRATPGWSPWAWAGVAGLLGFWGVSMYTQIKFPLNPPGIGDEGTLLARQGFQFLFIAVSTIAAGLVIYGAGVVNRTTAGRARWPRYAVIGIAYAAVALLLAYAIPGVAGRRPGLAAGRADHNVPHLYRIGPFPALDGHCLCHGGLQSLSGAGHSRLPAVAAGLGRLKSGIVLKSVKALL